MFSVVNGSPCTWVCNLIVWDIKTKVFGREFVGFPTTSLVVVLDDKPKTVIEVKFNREKRAFVVYIVPCFVSYCLVCSGFEEFLWDIAAPSSVEGYAGFEDFLGSRRRREV